METNEKKNKSEGIEQSSPRNENEEYPNRYYTDLSQNGV